MSDKQYWQSFGELNESEQLKKLGQDEFKEELPFEDVDGSVLDSKSPRRDFLKYLGFSTAAASLAAGCKVPVRKAVPFANKPENVHPGVAKYYATTYVQDGDVIPVVAKVRDGRPIKIEGNPESSITGGGTSARAQASVLDLYDTYRLPHPKRKVGDKFEEIPTFEQLDKMIKDELAKNTKGVYLLTSTINSPSTLEIIRNYPGLTHVEYDGVSYSGLIEAYGRADQGLPSFRFDQADIIVSLGADFLGTWLSPVEFARQYAQKRKINESLPKAVMSKHYQFESFMSLTGASADERFTHKPSETGKVAVALLKSLSNPAAANALSDKNLAAGIAKVANDLATKPGNKLVVCGSNDPNVQRIVLAINNAIGAAGSTIDNSNPVYYRKGLDSKMNDLVAKMNAGDVGALFIYGANPAYDYHNADLFKSNLAKVPVSVSFSEKVDETASLCKFIVPNHHYLESWGDAEPKAGYLSFMQPTIFPLFKTRYFQTSLLKWSAADPNAANTNYENYFKTYWEGKLGKKEFTNALRKGVVEKGGQSNVASMITATAAIADTTGVAGQGPGQSTVTQAPPRVITATTDTTSAEQAIANTKSGAWEVVLYQTVALGTGKQAGNPWLQELPDPITKATWDNYAMISIAKAKELFGLDFLNYKKNEKAINDYEYFPSKPVISIKSGNKEIRLPILVIPGMNSDTIAIAVGYGRIASLGKAAEGVGQNAYQFATLNGANVNYFNTNVTVEKTGDTYKVAQMQVHNSYEGRTEVVKETTLATFNSDRNVYINEKKHMLDAYAPKTGNYAAEGTLYPDPASRNKGGIKWGMTIDMNSCVACGACVVACHAENNVPVVGKSQVARYHDMHWLRIDRYFVTAKANADDVKAVVFQPMLCQHCDNAPCENVCPVAATPHSQEGINMMTYNRCIGTRYCANNCPYKVRRFNWADFTGADSFRDNQDHLDPVVLQMNDDLTRMVLNPDVTVRSRGVMEKCTFCIQRTQEGKLNAKKENRTMKKDEVKSACMTACPTNAINFGNAFDPESPVSIVRKNNPQRSFHVIEQLHTLPNVTYLAKIRNTDEIIEAAHGSHAADTHAEERPAAHGTEAAH